jgi:NitT/TauT family transport system ATP-binding protein
VLSPRPGRVIQTVEVDLPRPRTMDMMGVPQFVELATQLRHLFGESSKQRLP